MMPFSKDISQKSLFLFNLCAANVLIRRNRYMFFPIYWQHGCGGQEPLRECGTSKMLMDLQTHFYVTGNKSAVRRPRLFLVHSQLFPNIIYTYTNSQKFHFIRHTRLALFFFWSGMMEPGSTSSKTKIYPGISILLFSNHQDSLIGCFRKISMCCGMLEELTVVACRCFLTWLLPK